MQGLDNRASDREVGRTDDICIHKYDGVALMLGMLLEVADGIGGREHLGFLDASQEAHNHFG